MRVSRLFVHGGVEVDQAVELDAEAGHYVRTVLRLKKDAPIIIFNGRGGEFLGRVVEASRQRVVIAIDQWTDRSVESPLFVTMGLAISRGDRMDLAVQKAVELGVHVLTPLMTERCVVQLKGDKLHQRTGHWQKIMQHASEQCGRTLVPELRTVSKLDAWLKAQQGLRIFLDPYAQHSLTDLSPETQRVTLLSGPEGGFADQEREAAKAAGFIPVKLGRRILRTETASLAALSAVQMLWGDFAKAEN